ncbi:dTMP kinase [Actinosynnema sp. NPDC059797]
MTSPSPDRLRLPGTLVSVDGPGGVGKSSTVARVMDLLVATGLAVHATTQPSRTPLGELIRHGTHLYRGVALARLCAGDRAHQHTTEILPALEAGAIVITDRYLPSSLVLQGLDGLSMDTVWTVNDGVHRPDLAVILTADPDVIARRLHSRGTHSRFEQAPDSSRHEVAGYHKSIDYLRERGWPVITFDVTTATVDTVAHTLAALIRTTHTPTAAHPVDQEFPACP